MMYRFVMLTVTLCGACFSWSAVRALPPLGLTHISMLPGGGLQIIDGSAYIGGRQHIWTVTGNGEVAALELFHPTLGSPNGIRRVVKGPDGDIYAAATFVSQDPDFRDGAVFRLDMPETPIVTWSSLVNLVGIDRDLRGVGNRYPGDGTVHFPVELFLDGSIVPLERPVDPQDGFPLYAAAWNVSESGYVVGEAALEKLEGAIWTPDGEFSYIPPIVSGPHASAAAVRDRNDGNGVNIGLEYVGRVKYGDEPTINLHERGSDDDIFGGVTVSQSDFALVHLNDPDPFDEIEVQGTFAYYPGIVPDDPAAVVPLEEVFPELTTIGLKAGGDLYAVDGRIYMTLRAEDGLYLFGARDPSVIPEPRAVMLALVAAGACAAGRRFWVHGATGAR